MAYERFTGDNAALLLIDHQVGTMARYILSPSRR